MKKLILTVIAMALTTLAATPAFAQNYRTRTHVAPMTSDSYYSYRGARARYGAGYDAGYEAYAAAPDDYAAVPDDTEAPQAGVYSYGRYRGWDPDPGIRFQLRRDTNDGN